MRCKDSSSYLRYLGEYMIIRHKEPLGLGLWALGV